MEFDSRRPDQLLASDLPIEQLEAIRHHLVVNRTGLWVFITKNAGKAWLSVADRWGARLCDDELLDIMMEVEDFQSKNIPAS